MALFFKKKPAEAPIESKWSVLPGTWEGKPMFVRRNESVAQMMNYSEYVFRVGVAVPLLKPDENGLPDSEETQVLNQIEDALNEQLEKSRDSIQVLAITTKGMREFIYYSRKPQTVEAGVNLVRGKFTTYQLQSYVQKDPEWQVYRQFTKESGIFKTNE